eukprot:19063-Pelagococcus_subviridis.AAC.1
MGGVGAGTSSGPWRYPRSCKMSFHSGSDSARKPRLRTFLRVAYASSAAAAAAEDGGGSTSPDADARSATPPRRAVEIRDDDG